MKILHLYKVNKQELEDMQKMNYDFTNFNDDKTVLQRLKNLEAYVNEHPLAKIFMLSSVSLDFTIDANNTINKSDLPDVKIDDIVVDKTATYGVVVSILSNQIIVKTKGTVGLTLVSQDNEEVIDFYESGDGYSYTIVSSYDFTYTGGVKLKAQATYKTPIEEFAGVTNAIFDKKTGMDFDLRYRKIVGKNKKVEEVRRLTIPLVPVDDSIVMETGYDNTIKIKAKQNKTPIEQANDYIVLNNIDGVYKIGGWNIVGGTNVAVTPNYDTHEFIISTDGGGGGASLYKHKVTVKDNATNRLTGFTVLKTTTDPITRDNLQYNFVTNEFFFGWYKGGESNQYKQAMCMFDYNTLQVLTPDGVYVYGTYLGNDDIEVEDVVMGV